MISFSALQRAENSSLRSFPTSSSRTRRFQCSSASRKFLTIDFGRKSSSPPRFQCSSASRKFLTEERYGIDVDADRFSALQRAENSSPNAGLRALRSMRVSVLFSEPKIPHRPSATPSARGGRVSVLFSEPKIPHLP